MGVIRKWYFVFVIAISLSACSSTDVPGAPGQTETLPSSSPKTTISPSPLVSVAPMETVLPTDKTSPLPTVTSHPLNIPETHWKSIAAVLTKRGLDPEKSKVVSAEAVEWPNGAWGCPQKGMIYTDAIEPGMRVIVEADGESYDFRFGRTEVPVLCEKTDN